MKRNIKKTTGRIIVLIIFFITLISCKSIANKEIVKNSLSQELEESQERIKALEAENKQLREKIDELSQSPGVLFREAVAIEKADPAFSIQNYNRIINEFPVSEYAVHAKENRSKLIETQINDLRKFIENSEYSQKETLVIINHKLDLYRKYLPESLVKKAEEKVGQLKTEINRIRYIQSRYDEIQEKTWHTTTRDTSIDTFRGEIDIEFYLGENPKTGHTWFRFRADYHGDNWIFYEKITMLGSNGARFEIELKDYEKDTDVSGTGVREWSDNYVTTNYEDIISLTKADSVRVRFDGKYRVDFTMTRNQLEAFREIVNQYIFLGEK